MIIQCDNCNTKFRLDDSKITETGVRVRCSRCSHTFIVHKEAPADDDAFDTLLAGFDSPPADDESTGHADRSEAHDTEARSDAAQEHAPVTSSEKVAEEEISLPQFGKSEEPAEKVDEDFSAVAEPADSVKEAETAAESAAPTEGTSGFFQKGVCLPQFRMSEEPSARGGEPEEALGKAHEDAEAAESAELTMKDSPTEESGAESPATDGAGSLPHDDWGLLAAASATQEGGDKPTMEDQRGIVAEEHDLPPLSIASRRRGSPFPVLLLGLLLILVVALAASVLFLKWPVDPATVIPPSVMKILGSASGTGGRTEVRNLNGAFLANREAGEIFIVSGDVLNKSGRVLTSLRVRCTVYDAAGQVLAQRTVYCGNSLSREQLAGMPFSELEKSMVRQFGDSLENLDVAPGKSIPFMAVFKGVPGGAANYGADVVDGQGIASKKR